MICYQVRQSVEAEADRLLRMLIRELMHAAYLSSKKSRAMLQFDSGECIDLMITILLANIDVLRLDQTDVFADADVSRDVMGPYLEHTSHCCISTNAASGTPNE
eukprot:scaffold25887_cov30-Cyclotella_meneghiniana.AAC.1